MRPAKGFCTAVVLALGLLPQACGGDSAQTKIVLFVSANEPLAERITRVGVYDLRDAQDPSPDTSQPFTRGVSQRFEQAPRPGRSDMRVRIVAWHDQDLIASASLRSEYTEGLSLYLRLTIDCEGTNDLGWHSASIKSSVSAIDTCGTSASVPSTTAGAAGTRQTTSNQRMGAGGETAGAAARESSAGKDGSSGTSAGSNGEDNGAGAGRAANDGIQPSPASGGAGAAGESGAQSGAGADAAGSGMATGSGGAAGQGGRAAAAGSSGGGAGGGSGVPANCYNWRTIQSAADVERITPGAYVAGIEQRQNPAEQVPQYVCLARPSPLTDKAVGKGSRWGCYIPGPDPATSYTATNNIDVLVSSNDQPCLAWKPFDGAREPDSNLVLGEGQQASKVCRVYHDGVGETRLTSGARVGQVRFEGGRWVCRFEFYFGDYHMTFTNAAGEQTEVLDYGP